MKNEIGNIFSRTPDDYAEVLDLDSSLEYEIRAKKLHKLFSEFIVPFTNKMLTRSGIKEMSQNEDDFLLPAVKEELEKLEKNQSAES